MLLSHRLVCRACGQSWSRAMGLAVVPFRFFNPVLAAKIKKNVGTALFGIPFFFPEMHHQHFFLERRAYLAVLVGILHAGGQRRGKENCTLLPESPKSGLSNACWGCCEPSKILTRHRVPFRVIFGRNFRVLPFGVIKPV